MSVTHHPDAIPPMAQRGQPQPHPQLLDQRATSFVLTPSSPTASSPAPMLLAVAFRWFVRVSAAFMCALSAWLCSRQFSFIANSLRLTPWDPTAWPFYEWSQPLEFDLITPSKSNTVLRVMVDALFNACLIAQFGVAHLGLARRSVLRVVGPRFHRCLFMVGTCVSYHVIMLLWRHHEASKEGSWCVVWDMIWLIQPLLRLIGVPSQYVSHDFILQFILPLFSLPFIAFIMLSVIQLDLLHFIGIKQCFMSEREERRLIDKQRREGEQEKAAKVVASAGAMEAGEDTSMAASPVPRALSPVADGKQLNVTGMYRYVRHPMYCWLQLLCICSPYMTFDRLCYFLFTTLLLLIGLHFEERKLIREFGRAYVQYQRTTPMLFPLHFHCTYIWPWKRMDRMQRSTHDDKKAE